MVLIRKKPLKFNGLFTIQGSSKDSLKTILADYSSSGEIRGYANYDLKNIKLENEQVEIENYMSKGHLAFTAMESKSNKRYQGIIPVQEGDFSNSIDYYFKKYIFSGLFWWIYNSTSRFC